jgi:GrpB-like predicted nucleotidyltransferase (UPF0157 family)/GNAT superfamily N-acetyltransferase
MKQEQRLIEVMPYNVNWPLQFIEEAQRIKEALGANCVEIHHMGSTSVPELAAKPIIDMLPVVLDINKVDAANVSMQAFGYEAKGEFGIPFRRYFQKGGNQRTHQAHVFELGNPEIERHLKFRDWMRTHPKDKEAYARLKQNLAALHPYDIDSYCLGKEEFIAAIDKKVGFNGLRIVKALTTREWDAARRLRRKAGFSDTDTAFNDEAHVHFVLFQGSEIIGYAYLQLCSKGRSVLRVLVIDEAKRNHQYGSRLLNLCEKWLKSQGYLSLHVEAPHHTLNFIALMLIFLCFSMILMVIKGRLTILLWEKYYDSN